MKQNVNPIPQGYHTATPYLVIRDAARALDFYKKAFGAKELFRMPAPDGARIMHAEMIIGNSHIMLTDENPAMCAKSPQTLNGTPVSLFLYVEDADGFFKQAVSAGATSIMQPQDMFWGDRFGKLSDPFGHEWSVATHIEDVAPEEMGKRMQAQFAKAGA